MQRACAHVACDCEPHEPATVGSIVVDVVGKAVVDVVGMSVVVLVDVGTDVVCVVAVVAVVVKGSGLFAIVLVEESGIHLDEIFHQMS